MKTIIQIKQLVEMISTSTTTDNSALIETVRDSYVPLFQFNLDASSQEINSVKFSYNFLFSYFISFKVIG